MEHVSDGESNCSLSTVTKGLVQRLENVKIKEE